MRIKVIALAMFCVVGLAACSSSGSGTGSQLIPSSHGASAASGASGSPQASASAASTGGTILGGGASSKVCSELQALQTKLSSAGASLTDPTQAKAYFDAVIQALKDAKSGAPANVSAALDDLISAMQSAETALANPSAANTTALEALGTKLEADSATIGTYLEQSCIGLK